MTGAPARGQGSQGASGRAAPRRREGTLAGAAVALAAAAALAPILANGFVDWDDFETIVANPHLAHPDGAGLAALWTGPRMGLYVPLTYSAWFAIAKLQAAAGLFGSGGAPHPAGFHAASLLLHVATSIAVLALLRRLTGVLSGALLGALVFATHPLQVEAVAWASGTKDVLSTLLGVLALVVHARAVAPDVRSGARAGGGLALHGLATALYAAALLAKPAAVWVALAAPALDALVLRVPLRRAALLALPWIALAGLLALVTHEAQGGGTRLAVPLALRPLVAADAFSFYVVKLFWPFGLAPDYGRTPDAVRTAGGAVVACLAPAAAAAGVAFAGRLRRELAAALLVFTLALLPVLGFVPFTFQTISTVSDRYVYPALLGPALAIAVLAPRVPSRALAVAGAAIVVALSTLSFRQAQRWRDTTTLFAQVLRVNPESYSADVALARLAEARGDRAEAIARYQRAVALHPDAPLVVRAEANLGFLLVADGRRRDALRHLARAHARLPGESVVTLAYARALQEEGRTVEAVAVYERALALPDAPVDVANDLAWILATSPAPGVRNPSRAVAVAEAATRGSVAPPPELLDTLAAAYAAAGRLPEARATAARAAAEARRTGRADLAADIEGRAAAWSAASGDAGAGGAQPSP